MNQVYYPILTEDESRLPFFVKSVGIQEDQEEINRPKGYPDFHWIHVTKGKGRVEIDGKEMIITANMGFFIYPGIKHNYYGIEKKWETHWLTFNGSAVRMLLEQIGLSTSGEFYVHKDQRLEEDFTRILSAASGNSSANGYQLSVYLYEFLMNCRTTISENQRTGPDRGEQLKPVIAFMKENYAQNLSLEEISKVINITPHHLCRLFMEQLAMRPIEYLTKLRMKKAKELMTNGINPSVKDIAKQTGFNDESYFCAVFKKHEGITPGAFKKGQS